MSTCFVWHQRKATPVLVPDSLFAKHGLLWAVSVVGGGDGGVI